MKLKYIGFGLLLFNLVSCQEKQNATTSKGDNRKKDLVMNENNINRILKKQVEAGNDQVYGSYHDYSKEDFDESIKIIDTILKNNGYKNIGNENFNKKIYTIFNRTIDNKSTNQYLKIDTYKDNICDKTLTYSPYSADAQFLYVIKEQNFISYFYPLPEIIDYLKLYPEMAQYEKEGDIIEDKIENIKVKASQWKDDLKGLQEKRKKNIQTTVARNMYLFNDSRAHYKWLILNDAIFMEDLLTTFGYDEDKELLKWVLEKNLPKYKSYPKQDVMEKYGKLLWNKKCDNVVVVNNNVLNEIKEIATRKNPDLLLNLSDYIESFFRYQDVQYTDLNFSQKAKLLARLLEFGEQFKYDPTFNFNQMFLGRFIYYLDVKKEYKKEFEKNDFYTLPNLKKWYQAAEKEKDIFKDDQDLMDDPQPQDYLYKAH